MIDIVNKKSLTKFSRRQPPQKSTKNLGRVHVVVNLSPKACGLTARRSFTHCWQKDYLSASGWGEGKITVSGFEPDPTSIVSPSLLVWASPRAPAFLRQAALISVNTYSIAHQFHR